MYELGLEKAEETDIKLSAFVGSKRKQRNSRKTSIFIDSAKAFDCVDPSKLENSSRDGSTRSPYLIPEKPVCGLRSNS